MNPKMKLDEYVAEFGPGEYAKLKQTQQELEDCTIWTSTQSRFSIEALADPMKAREIFTRPGNAIPLEVLMDTADNSEFLIKFVPDGKLDEEQFCVRNCAFPSLESTVRLDGQGLYAPNAADRAIGWTAFLSAARPLSKVMIRGDKVSAVVSPKYEHLPIPALLEATEMLEMNFGIPEFLSGSVSHSLTTAKFKYPDIATEITAAYAKALAAHGRTLGPNEQIVPVVEFRSSDTTGEAAKLLPYLQLGPGHYMPLGKGVHVAHITPVEFDENKNRISAMTKFEREMQTLYSKLEYDLNTIIPAMLEVPIKHPANTFIGLCKYAQVPQKWGGPVEEELRMDWPDDSGATFLDVYEYLTSVTKKALEDIPAHSERMLVLEEGLTRIANNKALWSKYDLPGTVAWTQQIPNK